MCPYTAELIQIVSEKYHYEIPLLLPTATSKPFSSFAFNHSATIGRNCAHFTVVPFPFSLHWGGGGVDYSICPVFSCDSCLSVPLPSSSCTGSSTQHTLQSPPPCLEIPAQHGPSLHIQSSPFLCTPAHLLSTPHCRLCSMDDRAFSVAGPQLRNVKPQGLSQCTSVASSKVQLQTHLCRPAPLSAS